MDAARTEHHAGMITVREAIHEAVGALPSGSKRDSETAATSTGAAGSAPKRARVYADAVASSDSSSDDNSDEEAAAPPAATTVPAETEAKPDGVAAETKAASGDGDKGESAAGAEAGSGNSSDTAATGQQTALWSDRATTDGLQEMLSLPKAAAESPATQAADRAAAERAAQEPVRPLHQFVCLLTVATCCRSWRQWSGHCATVCCCS